MKTDTSLAYHIAVKFEETRFEKKDNVIFENAFQDSKFVAHEIAELIHLKQTKNESCMPGLATASSPIKVYRELVRMHREENLGFSNVISFPVLL